MGKGFDKVLDWLGLGLPPVNMNEEQADRYFRTYHPDGKLRFIVPLGRTVERACEPADALIARVRRSMKE